MLRALTLGGLHLSGIERGEEAGGILLTATVQGEGATDLMFEQAAQRIAAEPGLAAVRWAPVEDN